MHLYSVMSLILCILHKNILDIIYTHEQTIGVMQADLDLLFKILYSKMTLTFSHSPLWKPYRTTIIHMVNVVHAKRHV